MKFSYQLILAIVQFLPFSQICKAQSWDKILQQIEQNNLELKASEQQTTANELKAKTSLNLPDPEVSYSSVYTNGRTPGHGTEFTATQSFEFPTYYLSQNKSVKLQKEALTISKRLTRRNVLLAAQLLCIDFIFYQNTAELLDLRKQRADSLYTQLNRSSEEGNLSAITANRFELERLNIQTLVAQNDAAIRQTLQQLHALNGGHPLELAGLNYPIHTLSNDYNKVADEVLPTHLDVSLSLASSEVANQEVKVAKQGFLPKLNAGFKRSTDLMNSMNGFVVGISIPIFSNRNATHSAKAEALNQQLRYNDTKLQAEAWLMSLHNEAMKLKETLNATSVQRLESHLQLLDVALHEGHMTLTDYFTECEAIYSSLQTRLTIEHQYQRIVAQIYSNQL